MGAGTPEKCIRERRAGRWPGCRPAAHRRSCLLDAILLNQA